MIETTRIGSRLARRLLTATMLLAASGSSAAARQTPTPVRLDSNSLEAFDTPAVLQAGDVLHIQVWRQPEYSGQFEITSDGTIGHPLYRQLQAAGRRLADVEWDLHILLTRYLGEPNLVVEGLFQVAVGGEVRSPDIYALTTRTTIAAAVAQAGGPTQRGRVDRVILHRNGQPYMVDLTNPDVRLWDFEVRSGDQIVVEQRIDVFRQYVAPSAAVVGALAAVLRLII